MNKLLDYNNNNNNNNNNKITLVKIASITDYSTELHVFCIFKKNLNSPTVDLNSSRLLDRLCSHLYLKGFHPHVYSLACVPLSPFCCNLRLLNTIPGHHLPTACSLPHSRLDVPGLPDLRSGPGASV